MLLNKWFIGAVAAIVPVALLAYAIWFLSCLGCKAEDMRQGHMIVDAIKAHDKAINAGWRDGACSAAIRVYGVTDSDQQNAIISWVEDLKARGQVNRAVKLTFYERENMIYMPGNKPGFWGWRRGPEKIIRTVKL